MPKVKRSRQRFSKLYFNITKTSSTDDEHDAGLVACPDNDDESEAAVGSDQSSTEGDSTTSSCDSTVLSEDDDVLFRQPNWNLGECGVS